VLFEQKFIAQFDPDSRVWTPDQIYSLKGNSRQFLVTPFPEKVPGICGIFEKFGRFLQIF
jgi:hypothetical protein